MTSSPGDRIIVEVAPAGVMLHTTPRGLMAWVRVVDESGFGSQTLVFLPDSLVPTPPPTTEGQ